MRLLEYQRLAIVKDPNCVLRRIVINITINRHHAEQWAAAAFERFEKADRRGLLTDPAADPERALAAEQELDRAGALAENRESACLSNLRRALRRIQLSGTRRRLRHQAAHRREAHRARRRADSIKFSTTRHHAAFGVSTMTARNVSRARKALSVPSVPRRAIRAALDRQGVELRRGRPARRPSELPEDLSDHLSRLQARASELQELLWHLAHHNEQLAGVLTLAARTASDVNNGLDVQTLRRVLAGSEEAQTA